MQYAERIDESYDIFIRMLSKILFPDLFPPE